MTTCLNCGFLFERHYCPLCGQKAETGRLRLWELVRDLVAHWLEFNSTALYILLVGVTLAVLALPTVLPLINTG